MKCILIICVSTLFGVSQPNPYRVLVDDIGNEGAIIGSQGKKYRNK